MEKSKRQNLLVPGQSLTNTVDITIVDKIAEGGMGEVYEAILNGPFGFEKRVALKTVRPELYRNPSEDGSTQLNEVERENFLKKLVEEAKLVSSLIHTHIAQIYFCGIFQSDSGDNEGFFAMELINGVNLKNFMDKHASEGMYIPVELAVYIASRLARALEYAHERRRPTGEPLEIVHRDVTPTNILLSVEGVVKLSDFGIAKVRMTNMEEIEGAVVGKRSYMAPEQKAGGQVDFRADMYAVGLLLYEMLTNHLPDNPKMIQPASEFRRKIPDNVDAILMKALAFDRNNRFDKTGKMAIELERAIYEKVYEKGYGPTFVTLSHYLTDLYPRLNRELMAGKEDTTTIHTLHTKGV
ncbi:MAG: serine/threonine protein kinase [Candidatus Lindowbacteria bacterium]|nr:serine/threonine protein kinase [Candidatus Lindowbacteria bacterium]